MSYSIILGIQGIFKRVFQQNKEEKIVVMVNNWSRCSRTRSQKGWEPLGETMFLHTENTLKRCVVLVSRILMS